MTCRILLYCDDGSTLKVGEELAWELGAQLHEIEASTPEEGMWSRMKTGLFALLSRNLTIDVPDQPWDRSDLLILGAPIWQGRSARPLRQWLESQPALPERVAFLLTSDDSGYPAEAVEDLTALTGHKPVAVLHLGRGDLTSGAWKGPVEHFLDQCVVRYRQTA
ncbi:flavodoxin family protein [Pseudooceanicola sp. 200-1SW]|uniref:flavodoxin family protein n=1 Tax=Pseudooceanicola sp. 200-1SW TaxID=3425949 RepID=UPI003D7F3C3C